MILRKPYAFLIKHFRLIHIILTALATYVIYKHYHIISFFNKYLTNNYSGNYYQGFSSEYVSIYIYLAVLFILIGLIAILALFIYKKKKPKEYLISIGYYILLFVGFIVVKNAMLSIENGFINIEAARLYRDISLISIIPQIALIIFFVIQGLGIRIDRYNFKEDLKKLEVDSDSEEVLISFKGDTVKLQRNIRRFFREFIYYVKENKFVFTIIAIVGTIIGIIVIYNLLPKNVNGLFNQGDYFQDLGISYKLQDSIISNLDYNGNKINNKYYVIVKMYIENKSNNLQKLDLNRFRLEIDKNYIYPIYDKGIYFIDYARNINGNTIPKNSSGTYSLIYEINASDIKKQYRIKVDAGLSYSNNKLVGKYNYININPIVIDQIRLENTYDLGREINFVSSYLYNTKLKLSNLEITDLYTYNYEFCTKFNNCDTYIGQVKKDNLKNDTTLLVFDYEFVLDKNSSYYSGNINISNFIKNFAKLKYIYNNEEKYAEVYYATPNNLNNKLVIETTKRVNDADSAYLSFIIRNREYLVKIK